VEGAYWQGADADEEMELEKAAAVGEALGIANGRAAVAKLAATPADGHGLSVLVPTPEALSSFGAVPPPQFSALEMTSKVALSETGGTSPSEVKSSEALEATANSANHAEADNEDEDQDYDEDEDEDAEDDEEEDDEDKGETKLNVKAKRKMKVKAKKRLHGAEDKAEGQADSHKDSKTESQAEHQVNGQASGKVEEPADSLVQELTQVIESPDMGLMARLRERKIQAMGEAFKATLAKERLAKQLAMVGQPASKTVAADQ